MEKKKVKTEEKDDEIEYGKEEVKSEDDEKMICDDCKKEITGRVKEYLEDNPDIVADTFGGLNLCWKCQQKFKRVRTKENKDAKRYGEIKEEGHKDLKSLPKIRGLVENDMVEIFGDTGVGKSRLLHHFTKEVIMNKENILFIDTERNLGKDERLMIKDYYVYTPQLMGLTKIVENLSTDLDFVVIDSLGMPVLSRFAKMNMKERGEALLSLIAILGDLKEWTYVSGGTALFSNQPISEMAGGKDRRPFGDKASFVCKEILKLDLEDKGRITKSRLRTFRSRVYHYDTTIANIEISDDGVSMEWAI